MKKTYRMILDTGTTNSRVLLIDRDRRIIARRSSEAGVRNTAIDGNNSRLKEAVKQCLDGVLADAGSSYEEVETILASGMITSNVGLAEVPHLVAPAGKAELHAGIREILLPDVAPIPIRFIPGVKNAVDPVGTDNFDRMDIMRGEEVETMAVLEGMSGYSSLLLVLPGSHTKFVSVNADGQITGCLTTITGELLSCVTHNTILADAVSHQLVSGESYDEKWLLMGFRQAAACGIGRACFSGRILNQFVEKDTQRIANYILGAVLQNDLAAIKGSGAVAVDEDTRVIIAGKSPLRQALAAILQCDGYFKDVRELKWDRELPLSAMGALLVAADVHINGEERMDAKGTDYGL